MQANESAADRVIRAVVGLVLLGVGLFAAKGTGAVIADIVGAILLLTGLIGFCPLYRLLGISTAGAKRAPDQGQ